MFSALFCCCPLAPGFASVAEGVEHAALPLTPKPAIGDGQLHVVRIDLDLCGSDETGFNENDDNPRQWPLPNVLGVE